MLQLLHKVSLSVSGFENEIEDEKGEEETGEVAECQEDHEALGHAHEGHRRHSGSGIVVVVGIVVAAGVCGDQSAVSTIFHCVPKRVRNSVKN